MQEIIFTIIIFFILFRVFRPSVHVHYFNSNDRHHSNNPEKPDGKIHVDHIPDKKSSNKGKDDGDYVDYEEIK